MSEKRIRHRFASVRGGVVVEKEAHADIFRRGKGFGGPAGEEFKRHAGGIVGDPVEIRVGLREVGEAEEGEEGGIGAELEGEFGSGGGALSGDGGVKGLDDLGGEGGASNGADGVGGVIGEVEFVSVGQGAGLGEEGGREEGGWNAGVVDGGNV